MNRTRIFTHEGRARDWLARAGYGNEFDLLEDDKQQYVAAFTRPASLGSHQRAEMVLVMKDGKPTWHVTQRDIQD